MSEVNLSGALLLIEVAAQLVHHRELRATNYFVAQCSRLKSALDKRESMTFEQFKQAPIQMIAILAISAIPLAMSRAASDAKKPRSMMFENAG